MAAAYVSGYLLTDPPPGRERLLGADATHAWIRVWCSGAGWVDLDPTNAVAAGNSHVAIAMGRDYGDVVPLRIKKPVKPELQAFAGKSVVELARETGKDVVDAFLDLALADDFRTEFMSATMNTDAAAVAEIFLHPSAVLGLSDAGAHITQFSEAGQTSQLLGHWVRERGALSLEAAVRLITSAPAEIFGIPDRGRLAPGLAADITIFDPRAIACHEEEIVNDMPDGGPRYVARASGIQWSFVNGRPIVNRRKGHRDVPATTKESDAFSKDLKSRGFSFVGSTVIYAHMQAIGMVNDHVVGCFRYGEVHQPT